MKMHHSADPDEMQHYAFHLGLLSLPKYLLEVSSIQRVKIVHLRESSGSDVECLTRDREVAGSSLTCGTALCP